jgi:uncharacterized protein (TIGR03083 family)
MEKSEIWRVIDRERGELADLLASLSAEQWARPSLCAGWRVREVAAHLSIGPRARVGMVLVELAKARGGFNRFVDNTAKKEARRPVEEIVAELRGVTGSRRLAPGQQLLDCLMDVLVHGQDIAIPLGIERAMPPEAARISAEHTWNRGYPFHAQKRLAGRRLVATDVDWIVGHGAEIRGPIGSLLLLVSGRDVAWERLTAV